MLENNIGRSLSFTEECVRKLEEAFSIDTTVEEACFYANISRQTYYDHVKEGTELFDRFKALRERPVLKARQTIVKSLDEPEHAKWYLEKKRKKEFGNTMDITTDGKPLPILPYQAMVQSDSPQDVIPTDNSDNQNREVKEEDTSHSRGNV